MGIFNNYILLREGARDKALEMFMPYLQKRGINMSISQLKQVLLNKFVTEAGMHSLSLNSNFYLLGVSRYYFEGVLTTNKQLNILYPRVKDKFNPQVCQRLDALVEILRNSYVDSVGTKWEQPEDFGNLPIDKLLKKYNSKINKALGLDVAPEAQAEAPKVSEDYTAGKNYTYEILYSYEDARKYNKATEPGAWCITYGKQHYDGYVKRLKIHYVVFAQKGYESIPRKVGTGFTKRKPHDAYGNSLICVLQSNTSAKPIYITSRWNHGSTYDGTQGTEADHAYTTEEFLQTVGCDASVLERAFEQWKSNVDSDEVKNKNRSAMRADRLNAMRQLKYAQMMINGGADPFSLEYLDVRAIFSDNTSYTADGQKYNPKGMFFVSVAVNENETFTSIMDRKVIHFDKYLVTMTGRNDYHNLLGNKSDKFVVFRMAAIDNKQFMVYDRMRHRFLDLGGIYRFNHATSQLTGGYNSQGYKYAILAITGNQVGLLNLETMKPIKARNGSPWFESITTKDERGDSNVTYGGKISFPYSIENNVLHLVYDSASGEDYWYNTTTDSFLNVFEGVPEGFTVMRYVTNSHLPGKQYMGYTNNPKSNISFNKGTGDLYFFKNFNDGRPFSIQGTTIFRDFEKEKNVLGWIPEGEEYATYGDVETNKILEIDGKPVRTQYGVALETMDDYILISYSRWYKITEGPYEGRITYRDFYTKCLIYNPFTHEFYHDNKSGYIFNVWGGGYVKTPGAVCGNRRKDELIADGTIYKIPNAREPKTIIPNFVKDGY